MESVDSWVLVPLPQVTDTIEYIMMQQQKEIHLGTAHAQPGYNHVKKFVLLVLLFGNWYRYHACQASCAD